MHLCMNNAAKAAHEGLRACAACLQEPTLDMPKFVSQYTDHQCSTLTVHHAQCRPLLGPGPHLSRPALPPFCAVQFRQHLFEGLNCCWDGCTGLELKLLTFNRQLRIFGIMQMNLDWEHAGSISAKLQISAIPLIADSASSRCCTHPTAVPPLPCCVAQCAIASRNS